LGSAQLRCLVRENCIVNSGSIEAEKVLNSCVSTSFSRMALLLCVFSQVLYMSVAALPFVVIEYANLTYTHVIICL
jgi:hypothetical protein